MEDSTPLPELDADPIHELRIYRVAAGRARDMEARVQADLRTLFPKHGIRPLASWSTLVSPVSPAFVYLTPWPDMNQRSASWAGFYSDPEWRDVRARTNGGSELVESFEIMFVRALTPWTGAVERSAFSELIIQTTAIGKTSAVTAELIDHTIPALAAEGAQVHGVFDLISGRPLPALAMFVGWNSLDQRAAALAKLDARSLAARAANKAVLLDRAEQHLLRHVAVDWA
jgi:hypothetical protein